MHENTVMKLITLSYQFFFLCKSVCVHAGLCLWSKTKVTESLELDSHMVANCLTQVLRTELRSCAGAASAVKHKAFDLAPSFLNKKVYQC